MGNRLARHKTTALDQTLPWGPENGDVRSGAGGVAPTNAAADADDDAAENADGPTLPAHIDPSEDSPHPTEPASSAMDNGGAQSSARTGAPHRRRSSRSNELTPEQRVLRARMAAYRLHATHDPRETTRKAREAFASRFEREVDPEGLLTPAERARRAEAARRAYFTGLALKSSRARGRRRE